MAEVKVLATLSHTVRMVHIEEVRKQFALRLRKALAEKGIAEWGAGVRLAKITGTTPKAANKWLNGESMPSRANMQAIADELGQPIEYLEYGVGLQGILEGSVGEKAAIYGSRLKRVPVISWVAAGYWCDSPDPFEPGDAD